MGAVRQAFGYYFTSSYIESGAPRHAQRGLYTGRGGGKGFIGRGRRQNDEIDFIRRHAGVFQCVPRRRQRQVRRAFVLRRDMALPDAGALNDPFVGGVDPLRKLFVGDRPFRQISSATDDDGSAHHQIL